MCYMHMMDSLAPLALFLAQLYFVGAAATSILLVAAPRTYTVRLLLKVVLFWPSMTCMITLMLLYSIHFALRHRGQAPITRLLAEGLRRWEP